MALDLRSSELEHSFIKERIHNVEKHFSEISSKLSAYNKKEAHVRDCGDDLAKSILNFATKENLNITLRSSLMQFADLFIAIQEYRDAQIQRADVKVVLEFANYNSICKKAKSDLKTCFEIRAKEIAKKNQLEKARGKNPTDWQKIAQAERALNQAKDEATQTTVDLFKKIDNFERKKIEDIKNVLLEFIKIEMLFHAKAIELYTNAYNVIKTIKVEDDLKEFQSHFRSYTAPSEHVDVPVGYDQNNEENSSHTQHNMKFHVQNQTGQTENVSNISLKSCAKSKASFHAPTSSFLSPSSKKLRESGKSDTKSGIKVGNSSSSFGSFVESKFDFGDHCV
ncbi:protein FAM92A [Trichonephila inaurata madagascariensis]|uniref:Protein FAM92A n=1 Tax=Trichonephila inaurata madagascariensis TaxID=2747483 RepID=A0A8X6YGJ3_9ARAC|nr:protein FAM92A [Trichonephila inaurata madagascariensis]